MIGLTTPKSGAAAELVVAAAFLKLGCEVFRNVAAEGVDLVVYNGTEHLRVEVTSSRGMRNGKPFRTKHGRSNYDVLAVLGPGGVIGFHRVRAGAGGKPWLNPSAFETFLPATWAVEADQELAREPSEARPQLPALQ